MNGIICLNKPSGFTSFDVIAKLRGIMRIKRLGHAGTLDPMATGVLPVFVGYATRACDIMPDSSKCYRAGFRLGLTTDTQDITGAPLSQKQSDIKKSGIEAVLPEYTGDIEQIPPMYSAVQVNGQRLYDIARAGQTVERKPRSAAVSRLELVSFDADSQSGELVIDCSRGTYIRTIINDIGESLGCGAVMTSLERTRSGGFTLSDCVTLDEMQAIRDSGGDFEKILLPIDRVFDVYPEIRLNRVQTEKFINGVRLDLNRVYHKQSAGYHRVYGNDGRFLGLASLDNEKNILKIEKMFCGKE